MCNVIDTSWKGTFVLRKGRPEIANSKACPRHSIHVEMLPFTNEMYFSISVWLQNHWFLIKIATELKKRETYKKGT